MSIFIGVEQDTNTKELNRLLKDKEIGDLKKAARYLGALPQFDGSPATMVGRRCSAAEEAFCSMDKAWRSSISKATKKMVFKGLV